MTHGMRARYCVSWGPTKQQGEGLSLRLRLVCGHSYLTTKTFPCVLIQINVTDNVTHKSLWMTASGLFYSPCRVKSYSQQSACHLPATTLLVINHLPTLTGSSWILLAAYCGERYDLPTIGIWLADTFLRDCPLQPEPHYEKSSLVTDQFGCRKQCRAETRAGLLVYHLPSVNSSTPPTSLHMN